MVNANKHDSKNSNTISQQCLVPKPFKNIPVDERKVLEQQASLFVHRVDTQDHAADRYRVALLSVSEDPPDQHH